MMMDHSVEFMLLPVIYICNEGFLLNRASQEACPFLSLFLFWDDVPFKNFLWKILFLLKVIKWWKVIMEIEIYSLYFYKSSEG